MSPANSSTPSVDVPGVEALIVDINAFIMQLRMDNRIAIHQGIDQFYYMEKREELIVLDARIGELQARIDLMQNQRQLCYVEVKQRLGIDRAWLTEQK